MIIATYLPIYRLHELEIFERNVQIARADSIVLCIDYYFIEKQNHVLKLYNFSQELEIIKGNWRNRSSCLLRLVKYIMESNEDGLIVDSDVILPNNWPEIDSRLNLPFYHIAHDIWKHQRVIKHEKYNDIDVYYWKIKNYFTRTMHVFAGPKLAIRYKNLKLSTEIIEKLIKFFDEVDTYYTSIIADEIALGIAYDKSDVKETPFIVGAQHYAHNSYPKIKQDKRLFKCIYSKALIKLYTQFNYYIPAMRYLISSGLNCI